MSEHGRDVEYLDRREPLAYGYDGLSLIAVAYDEAIVEHWELATNYTVSRTPQGDGDE